MNIPLVDLKAQYSSIQEEIEAAIAEVMASQLLILGPQVKACEEAIASYSQCSHAVGVSSGTDALLICLMAEGIGPGDEVITTPYTFFSTVGSIARVGATPVFVDIDPVTYNLDPSQIASKITTKTRAIIPVHLYGQMADMDPVMALADQHGLTVIEDAAQAIGAENNSQRAGSIGHYGCFSFFPTKNLGAAGDGGMVVTNDDARADRLMRLRVNGANSKYYHQVIGGNFRFDTLQAAIVSAKLRHLDEWTASRQRNAARYNRYFDECGLRVADSSQYFDTLTQSPNETTTGQFTKEAPNVIVPKSTTDRHIYNQYVIRVSSRDALKNVLQEKGVSTEIYYPILMHLQECFAHLGYTTGDFPQSEGAAAETLALPIYPELTDEQARYIVGCIGDYYRG